MSAVSGMTYALSGSAGSIASGKPKSDGRPSATSVHDSPASSERYTPPWNCMNIRSGRLGARSMWWTQRPASSSGVSSGR